MKKTFIILALMYFWFDVAQAQTPALPAEKKDTIHIEPREELPPIAVKIPKEVGNDDQVYIVVQKLPNFTGSDKALQKYLAKNLKYPKSAMENNIQGRVFVKFIVEKDGTLTKIEILKGMDNCKECDEEALRLVRAMPKWEPGNQNGNAVRVSHRVIIPFKLKK